MTRLPIVAAAVLALTACGTTSTAAAPPPAAPSVAPSAAAPPSTGSGFSPSANDRNNIPKRLGQTAGMLCPPNPTDLNTCDVQFTIERVSGCEGGGYPGDKVDGVRKIAWLRISTSRDYGSTDYNGEHPPVTISGTDMQAIDAAGVTRPAGPSTRWQCVPDSKQLATEWQRGSKYAGGVELVVPADTTSIVVKPSWSPGGWEFPAG